MVQKLSATISGNLMNFYAISFPIIFKTKLSDLPDSEVKKSVQFYVAHHLRKIKKECGICPSRRLLEHSDQGKMQTVILQAFSQPSKNRFLTIVTTWLSHQFFIKKIMFITVMIGWVPLHTLTYKIGQEPGIVMIGGSDSNVYHVIKADISSCSII